MPAQAIMVAGFNYNAWAKPPDGTNFAIFAKRRADRLIGQTRDLTVWLFDFGTGQLTVNPSARKRHWLPVRRFTRPSRAANYEGHDFKRSPEGVMSITDVYDHVKTIGRKAPDTLAELSFFSHGYYQGPILLNSYDGRPGEAARDPYDKDARYDKDFVAPNMSADDRTALRRAFAMGGRVWTWGCVFTAMFFEVFEAFSHTPAYRKAPPGRLPDNQALELKFRPDQAKRFFAHDTSFFPAPTAGGRPVLAFQRTIGQIKAFYSRGLRAVYAANFASVGRVLGYGALPGTWAGPEPGPTGLMRVPKTRVTGPDGQTFEGFGRYLDFWKGYFNVTEDHENHGYATFLPSRRIMGR